MPMKTERADVKTKPASTMEDDNLAMVVKDEKGDLHGGPIAEVPIIAPKPKTKVKDQEQNRSSVRVPLSPHEMELIMAPGLIRCCSFVQR